ncbi:MAG: acetyltransferase [Frankiales bacterium]|nr:acetyltransferase [Frankiales bacterium]
MADAGSAGHEVVVRPARVADDHALLGLDKATWSPTVSPAPFPSGRFFGSRGPEGVLVACLADRVVGYVTLRPPTSLPSSSHVLSIHGLAVHPDVQGRGVARKLLDAAEVYAAERGATRLTVRVLGPNAAARRVYDAQGYVVEGVQRGEFRLPIGPGGALVDVDDVLLAKDIATT